MQDVDQRTLWNLKYKQGLPSLTKPDPFFLSAYGRFVHPRFRKGGSVLDLAGGLGRHALWLAERKWRVTVVDISTVAIGKLSDDANQRNLKLSLFAQDTKEYDFRAARSFDLIILFYHLDRSLFEQIVSALNPGGMVICKMAVSWGPPPAARAAEESPLGKDELASLFRGLSVISHHERPVNGRGVVEFVGSKSKV